ncbi:MAG: hypothetical protein MR598_08335 [Erysipelotrichaceae bacterium]|nr:hypothetical protein [Erysipelotrichaceae bacterium]
MANEFYDKFRDFLKRHELYEEKSFQYIWKQAVFVDYREEDIRDLIGNCAVILDNKEKILNIIPCFPFLRDDITVVISIYAYVQALMQLPRLEKKYQENILYGYILPMYYEKLYILENENEVLLQYEENMINHLLKDGSSKYQDILKCRDELVAYSQNNNFSAMKIGRHAKRLARRYVNKNNT